MINVISVTKRKPWTIFCFMPDVQNSWQSISRWSNVKNEDFIVFNAQNYNLRLFKWLESQQLGLNLCLIIAKYYIYCASRDGQIYYLCIPQKQIVCREEQMQITNQFLITFLRSSTPRTRLCFSFCFIFFPLCFVQTFFSLFLQRFVSLFRTYKRVS